MLPKRMLNVIIQQEVIMAFVQWSDRLSVGIEAIDDQHKKLVSIVNRLYNAMKEKKGSEILGDVLSELIEYTKYHFTTEETVMKNNAYPHYLSHKSSHSQLVEKVMDLDIELKAGKIALSVQVFQFLKDWLVNHIQGEDKKYAPYLSTVTVK
jgi:hemerythrin